MNITILADFGQQVSSNGDEHRERTVFHSESSIRVKRRRKRCSQTLLNGRVEAKWAVGRLFFTQVLLPFDLWTVRKA